MKYPYVIEREDHDHYCGGVTREVTEQDELKSLKDLDIFLDSAIKLIMHVEAAITEVQAKCHSYDKPSYFDSFYSIVDKAGQGNSGIVHKVKHMKRRHKTASIL